jgi:hypothetical protein
MDLQMRNSAPLAAARASDVFCLAVERPENHPNLLKPQEALACQDASSAAIAAARDLVFEGLVEAGSLAESYSRSLAEAAWRGDRSTVEIHLRQLRDCIVTSIGIFKQLDGVEAKGGGA